MSEWPSTFVLISRGFESLCNGFRWLINYSCVFVGLSAGVRGLLAARASLGAADAVPKNLNEALKEMEAKILENKMAAKKLEGSGTTTEHPGKSNIRGCGTTTEHPGMLPTEHPGMLFHLEEIGVAQDIRFFRVTANEIKTR